jgi:hypothetical protein
VDAQPHSFNIGNFSCVRAAGQANSMDVEVMQENSQSCQFEVIPMNLTQEQLKELENGEPIRVTIGETQCILVREDVYQDEVDYSPLTAEEINLLADEANEIISQSETDD